MQNHSSKNAVSRDTRQRIRQLGELFFQLDEQEQLLVRRLYQLLARGRPVEIETLSQHTGLDLSTTTEIMDRWPGVFKDDGNAVIGFWGLAIEPVSAHRFIVDGQTLYAWCAWDTLFIPAYIGKTCQVHSICKQTGQPIELAVSPDGVIFAVPESTHLSFVLPNQADIEKEVVTSFCHYVHFFRDRPAAAAWTRNQDGGFVLGLDDAVAAAHHKIAFESRKPSVATKEDGNKCEAGNDPVSRQAPSVG